MRNQLHWMEDDLPHTQTGMKPEEVDAINDTFYVTMAAELIDGLTSYLPKADAFASFLEQRGDDGSDSGAS